MAENEMLEIHDDNLISKIAKFIESQCACLNRGPTSPADQCGLLVLAKLVRDRAWEKKPQAVA